MKINKAATMTTSTQLSRIRAVLFDLHGTLAHVKNPVSTEELSAYLFSRGYEVSPQQLNASWAFVVFIDYPKYGYKSWRSYFSRILQRLEVKADKQTLNELIKLLNRNMYQLYPDAAETVMKTKEKGLKTAVVTTIAYFQFKKAVKPLRDHLDFIMTGYEAGCDKTNLKMYKKVLEILKVKPQEAVMIGDNIPIDILLPKRLGINAILLDRKRENPECKEADATVNSLTGVLDIISKKS